MNHSRQSTPPPHMGLGGWFCAMTSVFVHKHLANDGLDDALNAFFGGMCTPRCDTCFMSIWVGISIFMVVLSLPVSYLAVRAKDQAEQSFETTVVCCYVVLTLAMFAFIAVWFGLVEPRFFS